MRFDPIMSFVLKMILYIHDVFYLLMLQICSFNPEYFDISVAFPLKSVWCLTFWQRIQETESSPWHAKWIHNSAVLYRSPLFRPQEKWAIILLSMLVHLAYGTIRILRQNSFGLFLTHPLYQHKYTDRQQKLPLFELTHPVPQLT